MFHLILRLYSFSMFTFLRIAMAVTNNAYSMMMDIFSILDDALRPNIAPPDPYSISNANRNNIRQIALTNHVRSNSRLSHTSTTSTQTEECIKVVSNDREKGSNTDIFIYNLDASKKLVITHRNIDSSSIMKSGQCRSSKQNKISRTKSFISDDSSSQSLGETTYSSSSQCSSSNMSIENDVSEGHILQFSRLTKTEEGNDRSRSTEENQYPICDNSNSKIEDCDEFENDLQEKELFETKEDIIQKTSSPIRMSAFSFIDPCNKLENSIQSKRYSFKDVSTKTSDESSISDGEETATNIESTILLDDGARRRLSLPASFNTSFKAAAFEAIKNEIAETIKNTSRHEKSMREIRYPLSESFLTKDNEESKEIFSCSSYESLPFSEHLHNAFEKNTFFSLYREDFISTSTPDFSSVDEFVEAFNKLKNTLSVSELVRNKHNAPFSSCTDPKMEVKFKRAHSYEILETKNSQESSSGTRSRASNNKYTARNIQSKHINDDVLAIKPDEKKLNPSLNSVDLIADECFSSSPSEDDVAFCKNCSKSSDEEREEEISQLIKSLFDKIADVEDDNTISIYSIYDDQKKLDYVSEEGNFIETMNDSTYQSSSIKQLKFEQDLNLKQSKSIENAENYKETNTKVPIKICEKETASECQRYEAEKKRYDLENTESSLNLHNDDISEYLLPKVITNQKDTKICENCDNFDQSFTSNDSSNMQTGESHESIIMGKNIVSRNDSLGHEIFVSFVEENSFQDTNLEESIRTSKQLACK